MVSSDIPEPSAAAPHEPVLRLGPTEVNPRALIAEFLGTLLLVFFAVGVAVFAKSFVGDLGIALGFGFVLLALVYTIGAVSGCHINPAVTLGMVLGRRMDPITGACYWASQIAGGIGGAALLYWLAQSVPAVRGNRGAFGSDGYAARSAVHITLGGAFLAEAILTALLVLVVLGTTHSSAIKGFDGLPIGFSLAIIHLIGIPLTGTSVNPARALGPALFASDNAMSQVWLFMVAPLVGAVIGTVAYALTHGLAAPAAARPAPAAAGVGAAGGSLAAAGGGVPSGGGMASAARSVRPATAGASRVSAAGPHRRR